MSTRTEPRTERDTHARLREWIAEALRELEAVQRQDGYARSTQALLDRGWELLGASLRGEEDGPCE